MHKIDDFSDSEIWTIETTLKERYGEPRQIELAESEIRLHPTDREVTLCPVVYWEDQDCHFVICKTGDRRYRCQFFYRIHQQFGTGVEEYDDLAECTVSLLQAQADYERERRSETGDA